MPQVGETKRGRELGRKPTRKFIWHACEGCGKERWVQLKNNLPVSVRCQPCARKGNRNSWEGGRYISHGYVLVKLYPGDFFYPMANHDGYVFEHRLVMAKALGRCLHSWEIVHHKPGVAKDDNRVNGLQVTSRAGHLHADENSVKQLEQRVAEQAEKIRLLRWQVKKLNAEVWQLKQVKML